MRRRRHSKEGLEFGGRGTVAEQQSNLASRLEVKQKHRDTGEGQTRKGVSDLRGVSGVCDAGKQRGKNHQRNGGGYPSEPESTLLALAALFLAGQELPLSLGHFCHETLQELSFPYLATRHIFVLRF